jgi:predicted component of type VI protein secretion system
MDASLKIQVVSLSGRPPDMPWEVCLDHNGGTIGRLATNQLVLPDPERRVSGVHVRIVHGRDGYFALREGRNQTLLNGAPLRAGHQALLRDGDELAVSVYRLRVFLTADGAVAAPVRTSPRSVLFFSWETCTDTGPGKAGERPQAGGPVCPPPPQAAIPGGGASAPGDARASFWSGPPPTTAMQSFFEAASTRKAIDAALERFNPANLEHRLRQNFIFDSVLSGHRKALLWDVFGSLYGEIAREAGDEIRNALLTEFDRMGEHVQQRPAATERDSGETR